LLKASNPGNSANLANNSGNLADLLEVSGSAWRPSFSLEAAFPLAPHEREPWLG